jgi:peptide-methionine (S)-S-oxide reductase
VIKTTARSEVAVLAGGCFWGIQGVFAHVDGVTRVVSGYSGGRAETAHYDEVGTGSTGHAESVRITFDPSKVSYEDILRIFFSVATDPTQKDRQYPDVGTQYRSVIFYGDPDQKKVAEAYIAQLNAADAFGEPIVTEVAPLEGFYPAEAYHQDYLTLHPAATYIALYDLPKVRVLKALFPGRYRTRALRTDLTGEG